MAVYLRNPSSEFYHGICFLVVLGDLRRVTLGGVVLNDHIAEILEKELTLV
jgi:hypothetical protein